MLIEPNLSEVQDSLEAGVYTVQVSGAQVGQWDKEGRVTPYVKWELSTIDEADAKNNGRKLWDSTPVSGRGVFRLQNFYRAVTGETLSKEAPSFDTEQLVGRQLKVTVAINAAGYTEVKSYQALG